MRGRRRTEGQRGRGVLGILRGFLSRQPKQRRAAGRGGGRCSDLALHHGDSNGRHDADPLIGAGLDEEAGTLPRRRFAWDAAHTMMDDGFDGVQQAEEADDGDEGGGGIEGTSTYSREDVQRLIKEREMSKPIEEREREERQKRKSMEVILTSSKSPQGLLNLADAWIYEDWLDTVDEMPGNIYRIAAFGGLAIREEHPVQDVARWLGALTIFIVQLLGPPCVFISSTGWGVSEDKKYNWQNWNAPSGTPTSEHLLSDWQEFPVPKLLSVFFIFLYALNGLFVIVDERKCFEQMDKMLRYLDKTTAQFKWRGEFMLYMDCFMNNWIVLWCTIDGFLLVGNSRTVQDVLFDALSLLFLYNLDDVCGDLGFVDNDDWDGLRLGWIYEEMVENKFVPTGREDDIDDIQDEDISASSIFLCLYDVSVVLLAISSFVLPILSIFTPFGKIGPDD